MNPTEKTIELLDSCFAFLEKLPGQDKRLAELSMLRNRLSQPCVLAIAGKVKAGKSSFLNALMGVNLAKVGDLETTATINRFSYGVPEDPAHPVKVVWDNGMETYETMQFMDDLQGHDEASLKKAEGISYLEFKLENEWLRELTLVDTPGTDAVVGEDGMGHQNVTDAFFKLRDKHKRQTLQCTSEADAVIFLVGAVATANARKFLDDFKEASKGASALNAMGILSKIDIDANLTNRRRQQAEYVADSLREQLHIVIPVSAGLYMALEENKDRLPSMQQKLKTIPPKAFEYFMRQESSYLTSREDVLNALYRDADSNPISLDERKQIRGNLFWSIFRTIASVLYHCDTFNEAIEQLNDIANMDEVRKNIRELFFERSKVIRCYHVLNDLQMLLDDVRRNTFYDLKKREEEFGIWKKFVGDYLHLSRTYHTDQLLAFINQHSAALSDVENLRQRFVKDLVVPLENLQFQLRKYDGDYQMLKRLQSARDEWRSDEYEELCNLFGLYGERAVMPGLDAGERQMQWEAKSRLMIDKQMRQIAEYAVDVYGELMS